MTEKSEDQVIYYCNYCSGVNQKCTHSACTGNFEPYIPHSKYLDLKSDLAKAVEALERVIAQGEHGNELSLISSDFGIALDRCIKIAKEALGKIGEKDAK